MTWLGASRIEIILDEAEKELIKNNIELAGEKISRARKLYNEGAYNNKTLNESITNAEIKYRLKSIEATLLTENLDLVEKQINNLSLLYINGRLNEEEGNILFQYIEEYLAKKRELETANK